MRAFVSISFSRSTPNEKVSRDFLSDNAPDRVLDGLEEPVLLVSSNRFNQTLAMESELSL